VPISATPGTVLIVDTAPVTVPPTRGVELPVLVAINAAPVVIETKAETDEAADDRTTIKAAEASQPVMAAIAAPASEAPAIQEHEIALPPSGVLAVGGPFADVVPPSAQNSIRQQSAAVQRAARAAAIKKARAVRLARERRIAARRAAATRRAAQTSGAFGWTNPQSNYSFDSFNNRGSGNAASGTQPRQPATGL
jgi:hypothetical protein